MQSQPRRDEAIVAPQALFTMNSPFVIDQAMAVTTTRRFAACETDAERTAALFQAILQREAQPQEVVGVERFVVRQQRIEARAQASPRGVTSPWPLVAQSLFMSNEFQYVD